MRVRNATVFKLYFRAALSPSKVSADTSELIEFKCYKITLMLLT